MIQKDEEIGTTVSKLLFDEEWFDWRGVALGRGEGGPPLPLRHPTMSGMLTRNTTRRQWERFRGRPLPYPELLLWLAPYWRWSHPDGWPFENPDYIEVIRTRPTDEARFSWFQPVYLGRCPTMGSLIDGIHGQMPRASLAVHRIWIYSDTGRVEMSYCT